MNNSLHNANGIKQRHRPAPNSIHGLQIGQAFQVYKRGDGVEEEQYLLQTIFSCRYPTIWRFFDVLRMDQRARDADYVSCVNGEELPMKKKKFRKADKRIFEHYENFDAQNEFLRGISNNCVMDP
ncbi:hypothetical protein niasHT_026108 [Heterodera trifolii]|uniref:Uncharacterized protein n=1 Tax=Heterodera trifolii TaxID=157864 RepID=A0ABD2KQZ6_9BILA